MTWAGGRCIAHPGSVPLLGAPGLTGLFCRMGVVVITHPRAYNGQGYVDGRRRDLPAGALEAPTNRTELACSKRRVWGCHAASQDWPTVSGSRPCRPTWCSLSHPLP